MGCLGAGVGFEKKLLNDAIELSLCLIVVQ